VGSPGETQEHFEACLDYLKKIDFTYLHVFTYSHRENTEAVNIFPKVVEGEKKKRSDRLHDLSDRKRLLYYNSFVGQIKPVLLEAKNDNGLMYGFTREYIKVGIPFDKSLVNKIRNIEITALLPNGNATGRLV